MKLQNQLLSSILLAIFAVQTHAVDVDAGDYDVAPAGTNLALLYLQYANRDAIYNGSDKSPGNPKLESEVGIFRYVHYTDIAGYRVAPQILVPFGKLKAKDDISALGETSDIGDIILAAPVWVYNEPKSKSYLGITPYLYLPTGGYNKNEALNLGENRYKLDIQAEYTTRLTPKIAWDVAGDVIFYGDNDDAVGGRLSQDTGFQLQTNGRYFIQDNWDVRAGLSYLDAGDTKQKGIKSDSFTQSKFWLGTAYSPTPTTNVLVTYGRDIDVENGFKENNRVNLRLLKVF